MKATGENYGIGQRRHRTGRKIGREKDTVKADSAHRFTLHLYATLRRKEEDEVFGSRQLLRVRRAV